MRAKLKDGNQLILPDEVAQALHDVEYVDVEVKEGYLVFTPVPRTKADKVRRELAQKGITQEDIDDAIKWARGQ